MPEKDHREEEWFGKHVAVHQDLGDNIEEIIWKEPDSGIFKVSYIRNGPTIFISGDIGYSIFHNNSASFYWLAHSNYSYLREKLAACSESTGRHRGLVWKDEEAQTEIKREFRAQRLTLRENNKDTDAIKTQAKADTLKDLRDHLLQYTYSYEEFQHAIWDSQPDLADMFGSEWYEVISDSIGLIACNRVTGQLLGLRMALKQLEERETVPKGRSKE